MCPYTVLYFLDVYLKPYRRETQSSLRSWETDSDGHSRRLTLSSVSITLNSLHIIQHRPGTGDRQRAPVTSLQRQTSFGFFHWTMYGMVSWDGILSSSYLIQYCCSCFWCNKDIYFLNHIFLIFKMIAFLFSTIIIITLLSYEQLSTLAGH